MRNMFLSMLLICSLGASAQFSGNGSGTASDPYQITNADELFEMRNDLSASYKLMNDVDLTEWIAENSPTQGWNPIGNGSTPFSGDFDGNGFSVIGIYINRPSANNLGLFGCIERAYIKNLSIYKPVIIGNDNIGSIAGYNQIIKYADGSGNNGRISKIDKITLINPQINGNSNIGGVLGVQNYAYRKTDCDVKNVSIVNPMIFGTSSVGGIVGKVMGTTRYGAVSYLYGYNVIVGGSIRGYERVGGIVGDLSGYDEMGISSSFFSNYCSAKIDGYNYIGGICGYVQGGFFYNSGKGNNLKPSFSDNVFAGSIKSEMRTGGIVSYLCPYSTPKASTKIYRSISLERNVCCGNVFSNDSTSGILGTISTFPPSSTKDEITISKNVFCGDTLVSNNKKSSIYRISETEGNDNYALSTSKLIICGEEYFVNEDNAQQGVGYGKKTLMKQTTYEGLGYDFNNKWAILEGESYPYIITQSIPARITSFTCGKDAFIMGTAEVENKTHSCDGKVYIPKIPKYNHK